MLLTTVTPMHLIKMKINICQIIEWWTYRQRIRNSNRNWERGRTYKLEVHAAEMVPSPVSILT